MVEHDGPSDDGREGDGDSRQPGTDQAPARVPRALMMTLVDPQPMELPPPVEVHPMLPSGARMELEDPTTIFIQRLNVWKDELVAWFKTLASAAVYATLIVNKFAYRVGEPQIGDIVMLYYPINPDKSFVKRVIAQEGDEVRIVDGRVYVNDKPMPDDFVPPEYRSHDDLPTERVKDGYYFVMGDHRNNSSDSRHWGPVPKRYVIGKVQLRWWPIPNARIF